MQNLGPKVIFDNLPLLLDGLENTLYVALVSIIISMFTGFLFGILRMSKNKGLKLLTDIYLESLPKSQIEAKN